MLGRLFSMIIGILPQHAISRVVHGLARWRWRPWKNLLIRAFTRAYTVNLNEAASSERSNFESFNAFFTRALAPGAREIATGTHSMLARLMAKLANLARLRLGVSFKPRARITQPSTYSGVIQGSLSGLLMAPLPPSIYRPVTIIAFICRSPASLNKCCISLAGFLASPNHS